MALVTVSDTTLTDIADTIRSKLNTEDTYKPSEMADAIDSISGGGITPTGTIEITQNGVVDVTNYASADVDVPTGSTPVINSLSVTENGTYTAPSGVDGYSPITVNVSGETTPYTLDFPRKSKEITAFIYSYNKGTVKLQGTASENAIFVNLTDIISGRTTASPHPINNYPKWFTLSSGSHCVLTIKNVVNASNLSWNCNFRKANDTTSLDFGIGNGTHLNGETVTVDVSSSVDVGNLFVYVQSSFVSGNVLQFDIEFTVDGVRYF